MIPDSLYINNQMTGASQIALMADEKSPSRISRRPVAQERRYYESEFQ